MLLGGEEEFLKREKGKIMIHITSNSIDILNHLLDGEEEKNNKFLRVGWAQSAEEKYWINMIEIWNDFPDFVVATLCVLSFIFSGCK